MSLETLTLAKIDHRHLWHPFTQMEEWLGEEPLVIERAKGCLLYDTGGNDYIDAVSSLWCNVHGHNHPVMNEALKAQIEKVSHTTLLGLSNVPSILLAEKLSRLLPPGLARIFYSDSGAAAVEAALKMAVQYWHLKGERRTEFMAFEHAYHGDTFGSMSVGFSETFHKAFQPMLFPAYRFTPPYEIARRDGVSQREAEQLSLLSARDILAKFGNRLAACILEPMVQGAAGIWPHSAAYLKELYHLVKSHGVLFIADEVAVGFGRTGTMFAVEHAGITPDLLCLGKGLSGGTLPLAVTVTTEEIFNAFLGQFEAFRQFFHGHTFSGNPLGCAAGLASLQIFQEERTLEKLQPKIDFLWRFLNDEILPHPNVRDVRGLGFFAGIELGKEKHRPHPVEFRAGKKVMLAARKRGVIFRPLLDTVVLAPPLAIPDDLLRKLLIAIKESIEEVCA